MEINRVKTVLCNLIQNSTSINGTSSTASTILGTSWLSDFITRYKEVHYSTIFNKLVQ